MSRLGPDPETEAQFACISEFDPEIPFGDIYSNHQGQMLTLSGVHPCGDSTPPPGKLPLPGLGGSLWQSPTALEQLGR